MLYCREFSGVALPFLLVVLAGFVAKSVCKLLLL